MRVFKWDTSLAVRLPASLVDVLDLKEGDNIEIRIERKQGDRIVSTPDSRELLARLRNFRGRLPADFRFDRLEASERG